MAFSAKRSNGIEVSYKNTMVVLDSVRKSNLPVFISHAHGDHCKGFKAADETYSTRATLALAQIASGKARAQANHLVECLKPMPFGDVEVEAHNAGHILGSTQYEIVSPSGNAVYTGDIKFRDTLLTEKAEAVPCDLLIIESTYGTPCYFPSKEYMHERIVEWVFFSIKKGKIPAFQTDALGNAQELIALLNKLTDIPIITHTRVSAYSRVYQEFGHKLSYIDAQSEDGKEILDGGECALIMPKNVDLRSQHQLNVAFVSGWGSKFSGSRKAFCLSDHSDFYRLLEYVEKAKPKMVLTCHGNLHSKATLSKRIRRTLHISSSPLSKEEYVIPTEIEAPRSTRLGECVKEIMISVKPGFTYPRKWLISATSRSLRRFSQDEVETGLAESVKAGKLRYICEKDSYELRISERASQIEPS